MKYFKLGQTVYHGSYGEGKVISPYLNKYPVSVQFKHKEVAFTEDGREEHEEPISLSQTPIPPIVNKLLTDEYVQFTFENMLIGTIVKSKSTGAYFLITYQSKESILGANTVMTYKNLFEYYTFLDGSPCGKLA